MIREEMEQGRKKANRNKTIDFSLEEGRKYLDSCLYISKEKPGTDHLRDVEESIDRRRYI